MDFRLRRNAGDHALEDARNRSHCDRTHALKVAEQFVDVVRDVVMNSREHVAVNDAMLVNVRERQNREHITSRSKNAE